MSGVRPQGALYVKAPACRVVYAKPVSLAPSVVAGSRGLQRDGAKKYATTF